MLTRAAIALYQGWLQVGYATLYTMAPVFSLVLDRDVNEDLALLYPELYKDLTKGRSLSYKRSSHGSPSRFIKVSIPVLVSIGCWPRRTPMLTNCRRNHHATFTAFIRIRVSPYRGYLVHRARLERTHHGRARNHDMAHLHGIERARYCSRLLWVHGRVAGVLW